MFQGNKDMRKSGIENVGNLPWGTHFCQLYQTAEDLTDILVPYFQAGLENDEFCMWITSAPLTVEGAKDAMRKAVPHFESYLTNGQIEILPHDEWYLKDGVFDLQGVLDGWIHKLNWAMERGYRGMRLTGNTTWLEKKDWVNFFDYEKAVDTTIRNRQILAVCTYSLDTCNIHEVLDIVQNHQFTLIKRDGELKLIESSEQKRAKEALRESEEKYRKLSNAVEHSPCSIIITSTGGKIEYANPKFFQLTGYAPDEIVGENPRILQSGKTPVEKYKKMWTTIISGNTWKGEFINKKKNGEFYWELASVSPIKAPDGSITHFVAIKEDITERKHIENELRRQRDQLEHLTTQLTVTNKELEAFSYSVSHDLRAPLRSIDGFSRALMEDCAHTVEEQGKNYIQRIQAASQRMGHLIEDLLNLSRVTRSTMSPKSVDLSALVKAIANEVKEKQPERCAEFIIPDGVTVYGDPNLLQIAMENLINNAWKFTRNCPQAKIEFGSIQYNKERAYFIRDNGVGFDMTYANKLFTPFQRLCKATEFEGTGIGLATVQRIIHRHGGKIWAESAVDKGAVFYFTI
ncbi:MAG: PAS domain S-box protein [wastewater metagenome]|nr:PAS domain S-box protein [Candidatus Loosdrechtia aerotolerans]